jgi:alpha-beta hydrolase superfamily lysophospholipase
MRLVASLVLSGFVVVACSSKGGGNPQPTVKSAAPLASVPEVPKEPPTPSEPASFETADKVPLAGTIYLAKDPQAPVLVLVHRFRGDSQEWAAFAQRMAQAEHRYTIVNFDLRGHGASRSGTGKQRLDWADMKDQDMPAMVQDVRAAIDYGVQRAQGKPTRVVLVGSSLGAALAAREADEDGRVVAIALVSPGAAIQGYDVYRPFANVRMLPTFLAGAKEDNVSIEPLDALSRMAKEHATVKSYDGRGHGTFGLSQENNTLFKDLEDWLMSVYGAEPVQRDLTPPPTEPKKKERKG